MKLLLATRNPGKVREIRRILADLPELELLTHQGRSFDDVAETGQTFRENALLKARSACRGTGLPALAEDSGLEVDALGGRPGVRSARFAGAGATDQENIEKLLRLLKNVQDRRARFRCVAVLCFPGGRELLGEGVLEGRIAERPRGTSGFGYDPVFIPDGYDRTLAELGPGVKDRISHRRRALEQLKAQLKRFLLADAGQAT